MTLCIFAKEPIAGRVKTRLAASIGDAAAARLAAAFLVDTIVLVRSLGLPFVIAWSGRLEAAPRDVTVWPQGEGDLGERLEGVLTRALSCSPWAIALGADSPGLPHDYVRRGVDALQTHDAVIGPARDGGFYLLGLTLLEMGLLAGIPWSTSTTHARTVERLDARGHHVATLPTWFDVDEERDLACLASLLGRGVVRADETARALGIPIGDGAHSAEGS